MRLLTLLAWYAAWLAVAMKVRRDAWTSKLDQDDPGKSTLDKLVDEVKDIHISTYADVKSYVEKHFSEVEDFDGLKSKVTSVMDTVADEVSEYIASLEKKWTMKRAEIEKALDEKFAEKDAILNAAVEKWAELTDTTSDAVTSWIDTAKTRLASLRDTIKENIRVDVKAEKISTKKAPTKKPVAKKIPTKKPQA